MLVLVLLNGAAAVTAMLVAVALGAHGRPSLFALSALCGFLVVVHSAVLATGLVGWLTPGGLAIVVALAAAGACWLAARATPAAGAEAVPAPFTPATAFTPCLALLTGLWWAWPHLFEATRFWIWDDYSYHAVYPTLWVREHALVVPTPTQSFTGQAWFPLSASLVSAWFMTPFAASRGEAVAWVSLTGVLYGAIAAAATAELLARLGCRRGAWAVPVVVLVTSGRIATMASSFSDSDLALAVMLLAAFAFAMPRAGVERPREIRTDVAFVALLAGLAMGVKISAAPVVLVLLLVMLVRVRAHRLHARVIALFGAGWVVTAAYWYARNVVHMGNPLYPAKFLFWPGTTFTETTLREYAQVYGLGRAVRDALVVYLNWEYLHGGLAVAGLVGLAIWLVVRRSRGTRPQVYFASSALLVTAVVLVLLPVTPWSAGNVMTFRSGFVHWDSMRYIGVLALLGWAALGVFLDAGAGAPRWRTALAAFLTMAAVLSMQSSRRYSVSVLLGAVVLAVLATRLRWRLPTRRAPAFAGAAVVLALTAIVVTWHHAKAAATAASFHQERWFGAAAAVLDRQPAGTRLAMFGDQWTYPTFGARHHLITLRVEADGHLATTPITGRFTPGPVTVHPWTFGANLSAARIGLVVILHLPHPGRSPEWPSQAAALEAMGNARVLFRSPHVGIWKLAD